MIITFSGRPGSGKTTVAKQLARRLSYRHVYLGQLMRDLAKRRGLTLSQYHRLCEKDPRIDREIDLYQQRLGRQRRNLVIEGRTSFYFIPHSLKIFLDVSLEVGARRIWQDLQKKNSRNEGPKRLSVNGVKNLIKQRINSDQRRFRRYYGIDPFKRQHYDLFLNTSNLSPGQVLKKVHRFVVENSLAPTAKPKKAPKIKL